MWPASMSSPLLPLLLLTATWTKFIRWSLTTQALELSSSTWVFCFMHHLSLLHKGRRKLTKVWLVIILCMIMMTHESYDLTLNYSCRFCIYFPLIILKETNILYIKKIWKIMYTCKLFIISILYLIWILYYSVVIWLYLKCKSCQFEGVLVFLTNEIGP